MSGHESVRAGRQPDTVGPAERYDVPLADFTTLRLGGPAKRLVEPDTSADLVEAVRAVDDANEPLLLLGGGSNVVLPDEGFAGTVVRVATRGVEVESGASGPSARVRIAAGEDWDTCCARAVEEGWVGVEALSGIPGYVGAAPVQNVGAYGQELSDTVAQVVVWDRIERARRTLSLAEARFGYRTSRFKQDPKRFVVLEVVLQLGVGELAMPVRYAELARSLGVELGQRVPPREVRAAVLGLRRGKGMVLDADDPDTCSAGSFFTNPVLSQAQTVSLPAELPRWPQSDGRVKVSAAWLIERAGFTKGYGAGPVRLSTKHTLALTNRGDATTADLLRLAREVRDGVRACFGVGLEPEPSLIGCTL